MTPSRTPRGLTGHAEPHSDEWDARCVSCGQSFGIGDGWAFTNAAVACPYCGAVHDVFCDTQGDGHGYWFVAELVPGRDADDPA